ncbi:MAG: photoactive yellow protein [Planctomycetota bacterium]|nr:photoactive yellow protein [Planctomycetota bacterium]
MTTMMTRPTSVPANTFVPPEMFNMLGNITRNDIDACDFGVIQLDDTGNVVMVNRYQSDLGGVPVPSFEGKHWFTKIAPCTNNSLIYGTFKKGVAANNLNVVIPYTFTFKMKPTNVRLHLFRDTRTGKNFVFCVRA